MTNIISLITAMFLMFSLTSCENKTNENIKQNINSENVENHLENATADSLLPEYIGNFFELGTYTERIRLANSNNYSKIIVEDGIELPESKLLSVLFRTPTKETFLYNDTSDNILNFIEEIKLLQATIVNEKEWIELQKNNKGKVYETYIFLINAQSEYIRIDIQSYENGDHLISMFKNEEQLYAKVKCNEFLTEIAKRTKTKKFSDMNVLNIDKLEYNKEGEWIDVTDKHLNEFVRCITNAKTIQNYSAGCPFIDLKITTLNGEQYNALYSTDGCDILIIEDTTFDLGK